MPRQTFTLEQKNFARALKREGTEPCEIKKRFKDRYGVVVKPSTMSTWYNDQNMETHEQRVSTNTSMDSVETHVNPGQRPPIMLDMEFALLGMIKKANNIGTTTPRKSLQNMGKAIFDKLRASNIYDGPGRRRRSLSVLNEVQMNKLLEDISEDRILCPLCKAPVTSVSDDSLNVHLQIHLNPDDEQIPSPPGGKIFSFQGSDGWVRNFLHRHNPVFNQLETHKEHRNECSTEIEQFETDSSSDNENSVDTHKGSDVELDTQSDVQSERNIKENHVDQGFQSNLQKLSGKKELDDLFKDYKIKECSVRLKRLETSNIINKPSNVDQHKNHDFELDKQSDVELNEKSDGELDIDCIRNYVNTFLCTPGDVEPDTQSDVQSERNIKEIKGNHFDAIYECFVRLIQLETSNIFNKSSTVDQHKNHDFELDEQSDVELNEQSDGELDIDGICDHLSTLPCTPDGVCSCDTDFTSQIPEYIIDLFNMMPDNNIIIVDNDKIIYL